MVVLYWSLKRNFAGSHPKLRFELHHYLTKKIATFEVFKISEVFFCRDFDGRQKYDIIFPRSQPTCIEPYVPKTTYINRTLCHHR
ncbi:hypothetical protein BGP_4304 [Beggiatoa sp. PS]|nr:hypothetical protein BGP_4304 [Beggiatoa sp. PS]